MATFLMTLRVSARLAIAVALLAAAGCWHKSPQAAQEAEVLKQCNAGEISCIKPAESKTIIKCQAGDMPSCQALAATKCDRGDQHVCQSLAVIYKQLEPLCRAGNHAACADLKAPWPDAGFWRVDTQIAAAETACKSGDGQSCQALGTSVQAHGEQLIWLQSYVDRTASPAGAPPNP
ncbi:MAG TPA: hypothetical protein VMV27_01025 [Candidatus Binataceae bacterium]|nr:hypothetical protein [Candidatus Binataceae bacterium]